MNVIVAIIILICWTVSTTVGIQGLLEGCIEQLEEICNPYCLYHTYKVNLFGVILLTILVYIFLLPFPLIYWIYKLCTFGRR